MRSPKLTATERDARSAAVQRASWQRDPYRRRRALALGHVRGVAAARPDDLTFIRDVLDTITDAHERARGGAVSS